MSKIFDIFFDHIAGETVSATFAFILVFCIVAMFAYVIFKISVVEIRNNTDKKAKKKITAQEADWIKSEEGLKYFDNLIVTKILLDDDRIVKKVLKLIEQDLNNKIFKSTKEFYECIFKMREEYASKYVKRSELESLNREIDIIKEKQAKIEVYLGENL